MISFENSTTQLSLHPAAGAFDLRAAAGYPFLHNARPGLVYQSAGGGSQAVSLAALGAEAANPRRVETRQGILEACCTRFSPTQDGVACELTVGLVADEPLCLWKLRIANHGSRPVYLERLEMLGAARVQLVEGAGEARVLTNGWASWSHSGAYGVADRQRHSRLGPIQAPQNYNPGTPILRGAGQFSSDFFAVLGDRKSRRGLVAGFLSQREHYGSLRIAARPELTVSMWANGDGVRLDPGREMVTDWAAVAWLEMDSPDPLGGYLAAVAREYGVDAADPPETPLGWCSWYEYYTHIDAPTIEKNLRAAEQLRPEIPLQLIQIDDGFERQPGDWFDFKPGFPQGVARLAEQIRVAGFTPGLWLAPFIVHPAANLAKTHPDWLQRTRGGLLANAGFIWDKFTYGLDLTAPGALEYACQVVDQAAHAWGFPYLKLDFLYAGALPGARHDPTLTRAQVLRRGLQALRNAAGPETVLLGCGCPLGSAIGLVEAMRIGTDVSGSWEPDYAHLKPVIHKEPHIPSLRNALQNVLTRAPLHRRWWVNDPDCLLVRPGTQLTLAEVQSLATAIALTGGSLLLSDDLPALPTERRGIAEALLPVIGQRAQVLDWLDSHTPTRLRLDLDGPLGERHLLAAFNWTDRPEPVKLGVRDYRLPEGKAWSARSFWDGRVLPCVENAFSVGMVPPHGVALLAVTPFVMGVPVYCGSDLHVSQGMEVAGWQPGPGGLVVEFKLPRRADGVVDLRLPGPPKSARLNSTSVDFEDIHGLYRFCVAFDRQARLEITYDRGS